ncbi:hypothetical protein H8D36_03580 [archaeon]|nr:hypothetical protein [archaeon]MBL7057620.1 hypothetical protein [Candidatus Woesearchaeota archaeon]
MTKDIPVWVKVISVLYWIAAVLFIIGGLAMIFGASVMASIMPLFAMFSGLIILAGIIMIALGILDIFIALGLWKGQKWAWIIAIVFAIIGFVGAIVSIAGGNFSEIASLIIHGLIGGYLIWSKKVKAVFA